MNSVRKLNETFTPTNYNLSIDLSKAGEHEFSGLVDIAGELQAGKNEIVLHAKDLDIKSVSIDGKTADFSKGEFDELHLSQDGLAPGEHLVTISFGGKITDSMHGLYPCYFEHDGQKKKLFATQFESHHAREVFPCVDEPAAKATFDVTLTTLSGISVLSNQPVEWHREENGVLVTAFQTTPRMSTYLLAWVVGELHSKTNHTKTGTQVSVWATPAQSPESLDFALDSAKQIIEFYEEYFDTPYPLAKSDHVALPDFSSGAMENWGLVTYREVALLADPKTIDIRGRQYVASVIAHELAHMWFGNLVTMKWWDNLWLNESFATMVSYLAIDAIHPEWNTWLEFSSSESVMALRRDAIDGVQPVQTDVNHPDEISTLFDGAIVYAKGARLLRMLQKYVGDEAFRTGLKQYFKKYTYQNTEGDDLWREIAEASGKDIVNMMNTWISQSGYPVIHVSKRDENITLEQKQFFIGPHQESDRLWPVPLNATSKNTPELMTGKSLSFTNSSQEAFRLNDGDSAHFISYYDDALFADILSQIKHQQLKPLDRLQILHESTLLARGGVMNSSQLIPLLKTYSEETNEAVWEMIALALVELRKFVETDKKAETALRRLSGAVAAQQFERLGWKAKDNESEDDTKLRSTILSMIIYSEQPEALAYARALYDSIPLEEIDPELRALILGSVVRHGDDEIVDVLLKAYQETQNADLSQDIMAGLVSTRSPKKISQLLEAIKNPDIVRPQDVFRWFAYLMRGKDSRELAWQWVRDNWQWVIDTFSGDKSYDDFPRYSAAGLVTRKQLEEYREFFEPKKSEAALTRVITLGLLEIEGRVELIERDKEAVIEVLLGSNI